MLRAQRVARHQYDVSEITHFCINMWSCHLQFPLNLLLLPDGGYALSGLQNVCQNSEIP
ncbi:hypothetical protein SEETMRM10607_24410 [Salmonella enterica subsp. enterica serovar Typhimurium]|nr:hypothetical protein SEETMRM10607_24410 [Salmonella enterica subsp. enterica serovar Typhimurium]